MMKLQRTPPENRDITDFTLFNSVKLCKINTVIFSSDLLPLGSVNWNKLQRGNKIHNQYERRKIHFVTTLQERTWINV